MKNLFLLTVLLLTNLLTFSQTLKYGSLVEKGECEIYIGSDGVEYKVGDTLKVGLPSGLRSFAFIQSLDIMGTATYASSNFANTEVVIKKIKIIGSQRSGYKPSFQTKATAVSNFFIDFESALSSKEVMGKKGVISSEDAIIKLKKAKDKLDLGLITQEEYDKIKSELIQYIK